ncbi:hypothetical protein QJS10_CPB18g01053 [Acorus calamus]|uniref:Protein unc-13 homolog n=1 Tax=Acorus calamus TaxID=4465 RepID=A0AAV9CL20_ACOCL|nr:hypothetical protein QJS10_CPB18g01053 [Acorus calamus]
MASLFRDRTSSGDSKRETRHSINNNNNNNNNGNPRSTLSVNLSSPFDDLGRPISDAELRETAYEIFVGACRTSGGKPLTYVPQSERASSASPTTPSLQRSVTSAAASKMKRALGLKKSPSSASSTSAAGKGSPSSGGKVRRPATVGELVRVQMGVSEQTDGRIRRGLLRIAAGQLGRRIESMVMPLELLQQFKASDFTEQHEYESWQARNLKVLEEGLLLHPHLPLEKSDISAQRLRQLIRGAFERPLETGKNSESMQVLRTAVMSLAYRSFDGIPSETAHWADGHPLNLRLYQMLLEACFDSNEEGSIIEEIDEVMELIKKTWVILGMNQTLHNLCFTWVLFHHFVSTGQADNDLLSAADNQLAEVAKDAKATKDPLYSKVLSSILSSILGWTEKRLLAYHDTFDSSNIDSMEIIVSLGVSAAKILVEDISHEYRRRRREVVDVAQTRIDTYIRSSIRTAFAQRMEKADSSRRLSRNQTSPTHFLSILAIDIGDLANKEKQLFSPILQRWHPLAAGVAVATLHACYGNELKQFISGVTELTPDFVEVLKAADKLEKDLVHIAVEDSVDSEDGGKSLIREMPPYESEAAVANLAKSWIKTRVDRLKEWVDRNLQQEAWNPRASKESVAPSCVEILRVVSETLDAFFQLPILVHQALLPDLVSGIDKSLQGYIYKAKSGCGTRNTFIPALPELTRCTTDSKFHWKKKEKLPNTQKRRSQVGTLDKEGGSFGLPQLCVRMNTMHHIRAELENMEKRLVTSLRNVESAQLDISIGPDTNFELSIAACKEGIQQLCEATAYRIVFNDLNHVLWDFLYVGEISTSRIQSFLKELEPKLEMISNTVHDRVRNRAITAIMKASFDGFLLVTLCGGPTRAFSRQDSQIIEDDFKSLKDLFLADGDGLPEELVEKAAMPIKNVIPLFRTDAESLIERFRRLVVEAQGPSAKSKPLIPVSSGHWSPTDPYTILRVLCYRNEEAATKFLKKTYNLPKKIY